MVVILRIKFGGAFWAAMDNRYGRVDGIRSPCMLRKARSFKLAIREADRPQRDQQKLHPI